MMTVERTTDVAAVGAVSSLWWYEWLEQISNVAATFLPILGALWLVVQILHRVIPLLAKLLKWLRSGMK